MTKTQFLETLLHEGVRFYRVNGFSLSYENGGTLRGCIPLTLARKIRSIEDNGEFGISFGSSYVEQPDAWATNAELEDMLSESLQHISSAAAEFEAKRSEYIKQAEQAGKLDDIYVLSIYVNTVNGLRHIIRTIRESGYINKCVWHR